MKPKARRRIRAHHQLVGLYTVAAALLVIVNLAVLAIPTERANATTADNVKGWVWSSTGGWLSMNDTNTGSGGGSYGVNIDPSTREVTGFAWSTNQGWVCFGAECTLHPECSGLTPQGSNPAASVDVSGDLHGWAKFCNLGLGGWISLNSAEGGSGSYRAHVNFSTGLFSGFGWHAITSGLGWGWMSFSGVYMDTAAVEDFDTNPILCRNGLDDDLDAAFDCADSGCQFREPACPATELNCALIGQTNCCANGFDDDYDGAVDCNDVNCSGESVCMPENCSNGIDDNANGQIDCADAMCAGSPGCEICDNGVDDDGDTLIDCNDTDCSTAPECTPAWIESKYGNIYASYGIQGTSPPPLKSNATYCISSAGTITGFSSERGCVEQGESQISLPIAPEGYVSKLGKIDIVGILSGRYGQVENITSAAQIDNPLNGKVYVYSDPSCSAPFTLPMTNFSNANGATGQGSGLLVINGCDLRITGDLDYQSGGVTQSLKNLASFGILVLSKYSGTTYQKGGNLTIDPSVTKIVGSIFAERSISTGSTGSRDTDVQLRVYGSLVSRQINLNRRWSSANEAAELVEFDGRSVINPPPGYQDVPKSLPTLTDKY